MADPRKRLRAAAALVIASAAAAAALLTVSSAPDSLVRWTAAATAVVAIGLIFAQAPGRGVILALAAAALPAATFTTMDGGSDIVRGLSIAAPAIAGGLATASLTLGSRLATVLTLIGGFAGACTVLTYDPYRDADCSECRPNAIAVLANPTLTGSLALIGALLLGSGAIVAAWRLRRMSALLAALPAVAGVSGAIQPVLGATLAIAVAAAGALFVVTQYLVRRLRLRRLAELPPTHATMLESLRHAFGDPALRLDYADADSTFIDADGRPVSAEGAPVVSHDEVIAQVVTVSTAGSESIPSRLLAGIEELRLTVRLEARVRELRETRGVIVRRADAERRARERDLHDGAQQHILALGFDLRAVAASHDASPHATASIALAQGHVREALTAVREVSRGVYPPLLAVAGLGPALEALSRRPGGVLTSFVTGARPPASVERAIYLLAAELHADGDVTVNISRSGDQTLATMKCAARSTPELLAERIAALGGTVIRRDDGWEVRMPCE